MIYLLEIEHKEGKLQGLCQKFYCNDISMNEKYSDCHSCDCYRPNKFWAVIPSHASQIVSRETFSCSKLIINIRIGINPCLCTEAVV